MENKKETTEEQIHGIVTPIFDKILNKKEVSTGNESDTMGVCKYQEKSITFFWRHNNYLLQIPVNRESINLRIDTTLLNEKRIGSVFTTSKGRIKVSNFGSKISCKINDISLMLDKKFMTAKYSLRLEVFKDKFKKENKKAIYKIEANNINEIDKRIKERIKEIETKCIDAVKKFIKFYGGKADFDNVKFVAHEDAIHKEDWMPEEAIIYDTDFKKVYPNEIELKSPLLMKNYISNRVIEEIAPQIAKEIKEGNNSIETLKKTIVGDLNPILKDFTAQMRLHLEVQNETKETLRELRKPFFVRWYNYFRKRIIK